MIHIVGCSYDECKVLGVIGTKYAEYCTNKDQGSNPVPNKIFQKKNHSIINNVVDEI